MVSDENSAAIPVGDLVAGQTYRVVFDDCCVEGEFTGAFVRALLDGEGEPDGAEFSNGRIGPGWSGSWRIEHP